MIAGLELHLSIAVCCWGVGDGAAQYVGCCGETCEVWMEEVELMSVVLVHTYGKEGVIIGQETVSGQ